MDLTEFLSARLDEDEAAARESCYEGQRWLTEEEGVYRWPDDELVHMADRKADARHIARHDPARVLREVAVKRALIDAYGEQRPYDLPAGVHDVHDGRDDSERLRDEACLDAMEGVVRALATVYSDHPDYRPEWKP